ncbi:pimeloyl-ACP methyl ester carboxylesterase [Kitasatospora sp. MAA19]|uniref:alpha/beta hydrolase n=1 Tax=Kitasatospora sp. MAA19 TaxID=3035090 RepID=UPI0024769311|nr:alpha/beta hydrolase [Kitasatospora sp. MAA19]MDH6709447.1 pimeloyl-ACP methyl ester carboxylesterase [Kitasatospora sp. MAA19]
MTALLRRKAATGGLLVCLVLLPAVLAPSAAEAAPTAPAAPAALAWGACPAPTPNANGVPFPRDPREQCATLRVPRDYRDRRSGTLTLTVSRIRTADPAHRKGDLVVVPGGPGGSGLDYPGEAVSFLPPAVLASYDLIGFDERGVGNSTPVHCDLSEADRAAQLNYPFPAPDGSITANLAYARTVADACAAAGGSYLADITTANSARDLDRIRAALGVRRISYLGTSYATYLGQVYASLFPTRTDRVVLDSTVAPDGEQQGVSLFGEGAEDTFPALAGYLAARDATLHLGAAPEAVRATYLRLGAELDQAPLVLTDGRTLTGTVLRAVTYSSLTNPRYYPLAAVVLQLAATRATTPPGGSSGSPLPRVIPDNFVAAQDAVICDDSAWPRDPAYYAARTAADRERYPLTAGMGGNVWPCAFWHYRPKEPQVRPNPAGPRNVLLLQNRHDPATPYSGARQTLAAFGHRAAMLTVDAAGHGVDFGDPRVSGPFTAFLLTGRLPA